MQKVFEAAKAGDASRLTKLLTSCRFYQMLMRDSSCSRYVKDQWIRSPKFLLLLT
jgi:hypothetical protein